MSTLPELRRPAILLGRCHGEQLKRPFSTILSQSPAFVGQYIAPDKNVKMMIFDPKKDQSIWEEYMRGLTVASSKYGVEVSANLDQTVLIAAAVKQNDDGGDYMFGAVRVEGPFNRALDIPTIHGIHKLKGAEVVVNRVEELCFSKSPRVVAEVQGLWENDPTISGSHILARALLHLKWFINADFMVAASSHHTLACYRANGGFSTGDWLNLPKGTPIPTFNYPDEHDETSCIMIMPTYMDVFDGPTRQLIRYEQRVMEPAKQRYLQQQQKHTAGVGQCVEKDVCSPEILLDLDPRVKELQETAGITVVDHVPSMYEELSEGVLPKNTDPLVLEEPPHWIYLPWRHKLLRILGPNGYKLLRSDRNRYKMTVSDMKLLGSRSVGVIGLSVGHTCAVALAQGALCGHLNLADFDILELTNLNRIPVSIVELGSSKTAATARRIAEIDPYLTISTYDEGVTEENIGEFFRNMDCVVEVCARLQAAKSGTAVIMDTCDLGLLDVERFDLEPDRPPFHGLAGDSLVPADLSGLSTEDKGPFVLDIIEADKMSPRILASLMEVDRSISSWPQLAHDVALGGALTSVAVQRLFLDPDSLPSGRSRTDLNGALGRLEDPLLRPRPQAAAQPPMVRREKLPEDALEAIYTAAGLAPSGGNMQCWSFAHDENFFHVSAAPRSHVKLDVNFRGTAVACGAALANAAAVASMRGRAAPNPIRLVQGIDGAEDMLSNGESVRVGSVRLVDRAEQEEANEAWCNMGPFVNERVTNRQKGPRTPLSLEQVQQLQGCVGDRVKVHYTPVDHGSFEVVLDAFMASDRMRNLDAQMHRELFEEITFPDCGDDMQEGIDVRTLELSSNDQRMIRVLQRDDAVQLLSELDVGHRLGEGTRKSLLASSGIVTVGISGAGTFEDFVEGGIALEQVWLTATMLGLRMHPWTPLFGYTQSRSELSQLIGPSRCSELYPKGQAALDVLGLKDHKYVFSFRVHQGSPHTAISERHKPVMRSMGST